MIKQKAWSVYPTKLLLERLPKEAKKQKRSINQQIIFMLESCLEKDGKES